MKSKSKCCNAKIVPVDRYKDKLSPEYFSKCSKCGNPLFSTGELMPLANAAKINPTPPTTTGSIGTTFTGELPAPPTPTVEELLDGLIQIRTKEAMQYKNQATKAITRLIQEAQANHLSDLSRAVGLLQGLGHPDQYLEDRLKELKGGHDGEE